MGDRVTQGTLARGMSKLDARRARARPRGPSALPSNHEIVSYGCEVPLHAYKLMAIPLATRTCNSSKLRAKLGRCRANNTRLFRSIIAAGEYRFRRPVLPRERKRAIIDTAFCLETPK